MTRFWAGPASFSCGRDELRSARRFSPQRPRSSDTEFTEVQKEKSGDGQVNFRFLTQRREGPQRSQSKLDYLCALRIVLGVFALKCLFPVPWLKFKSAEIGRCCISTNRPYRFACKHRGESTEMFTAARRLCTVSGVLFRNDLSLAKGCRQARLDLLYALIPLLP